MVHPYVGRLSVEEKVMVKHMTKTSVKPRNILLTMKERNEKNVMTIKKVYNAMSVHRRSQRGHKQKCNRSCCYWNETCICICVGVKRCRMSCKIYIFWTHPNSVKLVNSFYIVILMDSTKRTSIGCRYLRLLGLHQLV